MSARTEIRTETRLVVAEAELARLRAELAKPRKVFILLGSDDYVARRILDVYVTRELAERDVASEKHLLISRQGEPKREIVEREVVS